MWGSHGPKIVDHNGANPADCGPWVPGAYPGVSGLRPYLFDDSDGYRLAARAALRRGERWWSSSRSIPRIRSRP